jgi:type I restriction enzyme S subunit
LIVDRVDMEAEPISRAIADTRKLVSLALEYRVGLITDVVTGQLDVRETAASLPDEAYEPDELSLVDEILEEADEADKETDELVEEVAE